MIAILKYTSQKMKEAIVRANRVLLILALTAALTLTASFASAAEIPFFKSWGVSAYINQDIDIDNGDLYSAGVLIHLAAPLMKEDGFRLDLRIEALVGSYWDYGSGVEVGLIPGLRAYLGSASLKPYLEGGIGPSYNGLDIEEVGTNFNFLSYGGVGLSYALSKGTCLEAGYRLRHISNAGASERNHGVTSNQVQIGLSFAF